MTPSLLMNVLYLGEVKQFRFTAPFRIGRAADCDVSLQDRFVSRVHARGYFEAGQWWIEDLNSSNGLFVNGQRLSKVLLGTGSTVRLGVEGLELHFAVEQIAEPPPPPEKLAPPPPLPPAPKPVMGGAASAANAERYFGKLKEGDTAGEHTMF